MSVEGRHNLRCLLQGWVTEYPYRHPAGYLGNKDQLSRIGLRCTRPLLHCTPTVRLWDRMYAD